jgi:hypothetical protein
VRGIQRGALDVEDIIIFRGERERGGVNGKLKIAYMSACMLLGTHARY